MTMCPSIVDLIEKLNDHGDDDMMNDDWIEGFECAVTFAREYVTEHGDIDTKLTEAINLADALRHLMNAQQLATLAALKALKP